MTYSPLHEAIITNAPVEASLLNYDPLESDNEGITPLSLAKYLGRKAWLKTFTEYPVKEERYYTKHTPYQFTPYLLFPSYDALISTRKKTKKDADLIQLGVQYSTELFHGKVLNAEVRYINNQVGFGLFSKEKYNAGAYVGEYVGIVEEHSSYFKMNNYLYQYPIPDSIGRPLSINAETISNHVRFINHSATPNCTMRYAFFDGIPHAILTTSREVAIGEQFTYNYGTAFWLLRGESQIIQL